MTDIRLVSADYNDLINNLKGESLETIEDNDM